MKQGTNYYIISLMRPRLMLVMCVILLPITVVVGLLEETRYGTIPLGIAYGVIIVMMILSSVLSLCTIGFLLCPTRWLREIAPMTERAREFPSDMTADRFHTANRLEIPLRSERYWRIEPRLRIMYTVVNIALLAVVVVLLITFQPDLEKWAHDIIYAE